MRTRRRRRTGRPAAGFSLIEAVVAMGFLSVALLAFGSHAISLSRNQKSADSTSAAHALAQQKLEQLRSLPFDADQLAPGTYTEPTTLGADGEPGGRFTRRWTVSAKDTPIWGLKTVTVRVSWIDSSRHSTSIASYVRCADIPCT